MSNELPEKRRVQLDFSREAFDQLAALKEASGDRSAAAVIRNSLRLYEWYLTKRKEGYQLQLVRDSEVVKVEVLF